MEQQTRRWDEESGTTIYMRSKVDAIDYKYFVEPNIPKFKVSQDWLDSIKASIPEFANQRKEKYIKEYGLTDYDATIIVKEKAISDYYEETIKLGANPKMASNWLTTMLLGYINKEYLSIDDVYLKPDMLVELINMINNKEISSKQAKDVFYECLKANKRPKDIVKEQGMTQLADDTSIRNIVNEVLDEQPDAINKYKAGRTNLLDFLVGQVMKKTRGQANPAMASSIMKEEIEKR